MLIGSNDKPLQTVQWQFGKVRLIDQTALAGKFDFHIPFEPGFVFGPNPGAPLVPNPAAESGTNFFTAIQEQLGLKLEPTRAPVDVVLVVNASQNVGSQ